MPLKVLFFRESLSHHSIASSFQVHHENEEDIRPGITTFQRKVRKKMKEKGGVLYSRFQTSMSLLLGLHHKETRRI
jgi:hypothetical protein